ncbi:MAG: ATP-binding cassette domain-containing protein [Actinobacteria bacterium]|nr:ATP-binding cassette domain-containing protein [Actinomycetota bacterium]MBM4270191.1 ATP-binding cassette domain-containing protein [Deltaproteobacteria bacterium]
MASAVEVLIDVAGVNHYFGSGSLRRQILFDVSTRVRAGEIVIVTGPSGSGKTTLLTLIGALRATQEGSVRVLDQQLRDASEATLVAVRRKIGFIFQLHNLLDALTVVQNVTMGLHKDLGLSMSEAGERAIEMLASVGLEEKASHYPSQLSGGQKQRVAIARALAGRPRVILADEPTASLDKQSGRDIVDRIRDLAKRDGCAVVLVTHDNRILDIADRIVHLDEGRLSTYAEAVRANTQRLLDTLAKSRPAGGLVRGIQGMPAADFVSFLDQVTGEAKQVLDAMMLGTDEAFAIMLQQVIEAITVKVGEILSADRASLLLADEARDELWSLVAETDSERPIEIRIPASTGIAGHVYRTGTPVNVPDAYASPHFNPDVDRQTGYWTKSMLVVPVLDHSKRPFAVLSLLNKQGADAFSDDDARRLAEFATSVGIVLETWYHASRGRRVAHPA